MSLVKSRGFLPFKIFTVCFILLIFFSVMVGLRSFFLDGETFSNSTVDILFGKINHLAVVMDGNRRWAKKRRLPPWHGHKYGAEAISKVVDFCLKKQIRFLSLYTFSLENINRSEEEKEHLFSMVAEHFEKCKNDLLSKRIRVNIIGDKALFPKSIASRLAEIEEVTKEGDVLVVSFMFFYGGRQEILAAVKNLCQKAKAGEIALEDLNEITFEQELWSHGIPNPDLLLRTGGRNRLSNFLLWQIAYTEVIFLDCYWPDISSELLEKSCRKFVEAERTFGS